MSFPRLLPSGRLGRLLHAPLTWMVVAEAGLIGCAVAAGWHVLEARRHHSPPVAAAVPGATSPGEHSPSPRPASPPPSQHSPTPRPPGSAAPRPAPGTGFELDSVNRDQAAWAGREWQILEMLTRASRAYLERVVVPAVERAEAR